MCGEGQLLGGHIGVIYTFVHSMSNIVCAKEMPRLITLMFIHVRYTHNVLVKTQRLEIKFFRLVAAHDGLVLPSSRHAWHDGGS